MKALIKKYGLLCLLALWWLPLTAQQSQVVDSTAGAVKADSSQQAAEQYILLQKQQQRIDSIIAVQLHKELGQEATDSKRRKQLEDSLHQLAIKDSVRQAEQLEQILKLKQHDKGYPVSLLNDTLFYVYTRIGSFSAAERAIAISERINKLYDDAFFKADSLKIVQNESEYDIVYNNDNIIMSVAPLDALWFNKPPDKLTTNYLNVIKREVLKAKEENSLLNWLKRLGLICLLIAGITIIIYGINRLFNYLSDILSRNNIKYFKGFSIGKVQLLSPAQHYTFAIRVNNVLRIAIIILALYLALPLFFSIFPQTKSFADILLHWIFTPVKAIIAGVINFLPDLFTIIIIYIATHYLIKLVRYFAAEIYKGTIQINGFYREWAWTTFKIIRFLIYAFMFVIVFPYLPGSKSPAFQGVSVFLGILVSLGSSSAIANMIAGLVITYMRPFKIGDRVKIGEVVGNVIEKNLLVIRIRTIKNEDITVPNSTVLNSHTINYSANAQEAGLIIHTTVTIGYDVPWRDMHQALKDAALKTEHVLQTPVPFVLQTSLEDFYVSYEINAYTKEANKQATIYSQLHQNIQDVCNERGIEIMSPHYGALRDGNTTTIPPNYIPREYKAPAFHVNTNGEATS
jgi:small-conductance mechanosensitive channel